MFPKKKFYKKKYFPNLPTKKNKKFRKFRNKKKILKKIPEHLEKKIYQNIYSLYI